MKDTVLYKILRPFLVSYLKLVYKPKIIGNYNVPNNKGYILVANHKNNLDFISMGMVTKRPVHFLAKNSLFKGLLKPVMNGAGAIPVDRTKKDRNCLINAKKALDNDLVVGIFPEGTFNKSNNPLLPFKMGAIKLAYDSGKPIIPIAILGEYKRGKLKVVIGEKFLVKDNDLEKENKKLMKKIELIIKSGSVL